MLQRANYNNKSNNKPKRATYVFQNIVKGRKKLKKLKDQTKIDDKKTSDNNNNSNMNNNNNNHITVAVVDCGSSKEVESCCGILIADCENMSQFSR